jgi:tRNA pseudouridine38-40 synthase
MRYFLFLAYDGSAYHGWQFQPNAVSVQETIQKSLSLLLQRETPIVGAGRTDTGVHARHMAAHFDTDTTLDGNQLKNLTHRLNLVLPPDIAIHCIRPVTPEAHARFSALSRTYKYYVHTAKDPFVRTYSDREYWHLDLDLMNEAAARLFDFSDFTSFAKLHTDTKTNICRIMQARWEETSPGEYVFTIQADRFLRNMVRAIVGTMFMVGRGKLSVPEFCATIQRHDRCAAGDSAPACALFLENVEYPDSIFL